VNITLYIQYTLAYVPWYAIINVIYTGRDHRGIYFHCINDGGMREEKKKRIKVYFAAIGTRATWRRETSRD